MGGLTIWKGRTEASLTKARGEREGAERRIVELEARRRARLVESDDIAGVDQVDQQIAGERRNITICDQRIAAIEADLRRQARDAREGQRQAAVKDIAGLFAKRRAIAVELEATIKRAAELYDQISDDKPIRAAWPFMSALPHWFSWRLSGLQWEIVSALQAIRRDMLPAEFIPVINERYRGDGVTRATFNDNGPAGIAATVTANAEHTLEYLRTANIHPAEPAPTDEAEAA